LPKQLCPDGKVLNFCYQAGPCGCEVYHQLTKLGQSCAVVAPSLIPRMPGVRIKTDRRDTMSLAKLHADGSLTAVWVSDKELVEAAGNSRLPASKSRTIEIRAEKTSERLQSIGWVGQKRLCERYQKKC
jgi:transposase